MQGQLKTLETVKTFMLAGNATLTLVSKVSGNRFTYKVRDPKDDEPRNVSMHFVSVLNGSDNENDFQYIGQVRSGVNGQRYEHGRKARISCDTPSAKAFNWFAHKILAESRLPDNIEVWHEGKCCRCGRKLTVPSSIENGIGPDCAEKM